MVSLERKRLREEEEEEEEVTADANSDGLEGWSGMELLFLGCQQLPEEEGVVRLHWFSRQTDADRQTASEGNKHSYF